jgi:hypothetical protein
MDRDLFDRAKVDIAPYGAGIIVAIDDFQIPFAGFGRAMELDLPRFRIAQRV